MIYKMIRPFASIRLKVSVLGLFICAFRRNVPLFGLGTMAKCGALEFSNPMKQSTIAELDAEAEKHSFDATRPIVKVPMLE